MLDCDVECDGELGSLARDSSRFKDRKPQEQSRDRRSNQGREDRGRTSAGGHSKDASRDHLSRGDRLLVPLCLAKGYQLWCLLRQEATVSRHTLKTSSDLRPL